MNEMNENSKLLQSGQSNPLEHDPVDYIDYFPGGKTDCFHFRIIEAFVNCDGYLTYKKLKES